MQSLFSRAKANTSSVKIHHKRTLTPDDIGRAQVLTGSSPPAQRSSSSKDKEAKSKRSRTHSGPTSGISSADLPPDEHGFIPLLPDGSFVPLLTPPKRVGTQQEYGYISTESDVFLGLDQANRLVDVVGKELNTRGLQTPLLFSTQALDVSAARVRSLIRTFLVTCQSPNLPHSSAPRRSPMSATQAEAKWREELKFADPHALAMVLKWGLARIARVQSGFEVRGFISLDDYILWRSKEEELSYPPDHFSAFLSVIPRMTHTLFLSLLSLFSRLCANSQSSGLTPQTLATHFGPLIFGLGAPSLSFGSTYTLYLRSVHATEHLILSYIVNADYEARNGVELPTRLKHWIKGYPNMLPKSIAELDKTRPTVRTIRVASVRRNVRLYSPDLVQTATLWSGEGDLTGRREWTRIVPSMRGEYSEPKYAEGFKKRLNLSKSFEPKAKYNSQAHLRVTESSTSLLRPNPIDELISRTHPELASSASTPVSLSSSEDRFKNLTELKWSIFAETGFDSPNAKLLQFDLSETARRNVRSPRKRDTLSWNDFSEIGFDRLSAKLSSTEGDPRYLDRAGTPMPPMSHDPLADALQFSVPTESPSAWTDHAVDWHRKLKKQQKILPQFGWETTPVAGREWIIEEGMAAAWCELCLSSRWVDWDEGTFRESNWALVCLLILETDMILSSHISFIAGGIQSTS
ncbi:uncharacterized protein EI90DRAFT_1341600 [Cantharellus anzutake]|uniref:uncharacterized protein n=1 Tax=Cantharellus anzutake TaxID=1750568 RepID=UPI001905CFA4|nr:uncharacterized protein EI90DRAFT_1341600 [Cantharellus anzutake]KAF8329758.1 hypothetical protein EI90DRAFT_1341600 [Cantharellus anzutake]